jgi:hypothetical protein
MKIKEVLQKLFDTKIYGITKSSEIDKLAQVISKKNNFQKGELLIYDDSMYSRKERKMIIVLFIKFSLENDDFHFWKFDVTEYEDNTYWSRVISDVCRL